MSKSERSETLEQKEPKAPGSKRGRRIVFGSVGCFCTAIAVIYAIPVNFYVGGYGNVLSASDAVLRAGSKGPVRAILAQSGERVKADQVIIELEDDVEVAEVDRWERELTAAQAGLKLLDQSVIIEKQRDQYELNSAKIQFEDSQAEYERIKGLRATNATSDQELRIAATKRDMDRVGVQEKSIDKHDLRLAQVDVQKRKIATIEAQLAGAKRVLARRKVYAPMSGVLVMHTLSIGQVVNANEVLGQIFDDRYYQMIAHIPEQFGAYLKEGQSVRIELSAYPEWLFDYFWGHTYWVSPVVNPQASGDGTVLIKARIEAVPPNTVLKAGMAGQLSVLAGRTSLLWRILGLRITSPTPTTQPVK